MAIGVGGKMHIYEAKRRLKSTIAWKKLDDFVKKKGSFLGSKGVGGASEAD